MLAVRLYLHHVLGIACTGDALDASESQRAI
jgi:hypothetical protein